MPLESVAGPKGSSGRPKTTQNLSPKFFGFLKIESKFGPMTPRPSNSSPFHLRQSLTQAARLLLPFPPRPRPPTPRAPPPSAPRAGCRNPRSPASRRLPQPAQSRRPRGPASRRRPPASGRLGPWASTRLPCPAGRCARARGRGKPTNPVRRHLPPSRAPARAHGRHLQPQPTLAVLLTGVG